MPEYRRFIAYFYEYIDGKKQKNAGFAKVELRNGMWRILFRLTTEVQPEPPMQVYGFVRVDGYLLGVPMGTIRSGREIAEEWAYQAEAPIGKSGHRLEDFAGIRVTSGDGRSFLTVWDDEPVQPERFVLELSKKEAMENETGPAAEAKQVSAEPAMYAEKEPDSEEPIMHAEETNSEKPIMHAEETDSEEPIMHAEETDSEEPIMHAEETDSEEPIMHAEEPISDEPAMRAEETGSDEPVMRAEETGSEEPAMRAEETGSDEPIIHAAEKKQVRYEDRRDARDGINELFKTRSHFQPFSDAEITNCIMIMPCDIIRLQQENWQVGRSSFLQHGFYQHRHLLLGTTCDGGYVIGVPGVRNPQEQYMAGMFGFDHFKTSKTCDCGKVFGYWYRDLKKTPMESGESCAQG